MYYVPNSASAVCVWSSAPAGFSIPQWVTAMLPIGRNSVLHCDNGQWFIDGEPIYNTPYIKTGTRRLNTVALSVRAALWI